MKFIHFMLLKGTQHFQLIIVDQGSDLLMPPCDHLFYFFYDGAQTLPVGK